MARQQAAHGALESSEDATLAKLPETFLTAPI